MEPSIRPAIDPELKCFIGVLETFQNLGADREFMAELAESFLKFYPEQFSRISQALDRQDGGELRSLLTELAYTAETFQAPSLVRQTTDIAELGVNESQFEIKNRWEELSDNYRHLLVALERFVRIVCK